MLDHCEECGTDFAYGLPMCPHCQAPNARLADDTTENAETATSDAEASEQAPEEKPAKAEQKPTPRQKPTGDKTELPDDAPKIDTK